ncbi:MAG: hypothetical protein Tsb0021_10760 [Chlamydiales bacterium]
MKTFLTYNLYLVIIFCTFLMVNELGSEPVQKEIPFLYSVDGSVKEVKVLEVKKESSFSSDTTEQKISPVDYAEFNIPNSPDLLVAEPFKYKTCASDQCSCQKDHEHCCGKETSCGETCYLQTDPCNACVVYECCCCCEDEEFYGYGGGGGGIGGGGGFGGYGLGGYGGGGGIVGDGDGDDNGGDDTDTTTDVGVTTTDGTDTNGMNIPEPSTYLLLGACLIIAWILQRARAKAKRSEKP